jgi:hypothetical protein
LRGVDREHRDGLTREVGEEPPHELVDQRGLARAAGARDAEHGDLGRVAKDLGEPSRRSVGVVGVVLGGGDEPPRRA